MFPMKSGLLASALPLVYAITFTTTPSNIQIGSPLTVSWTAASTDPSTFTIELNNPTLIVGPEIAIANSVASSQGIITISSVPDVPPGPGYALVAVPVNNVTNVLGQSGSFSIAAALSSTSSSATGTSSGASSASGSSPSGSGSGAASTATRPSSASNTASSVLSSAVSAASSLASSLSNSASASGSSSGSASSASQTPFNGAAAIGISAPAALLPAALTTLVGLAYGYFAL